MSVVTMKKLVGAPAVGDRLPNGAIVLDATIIERDMQEEGDYYYGFVLAMSGHEFIVWNLGIKPDGGIETWNGHYFKTVLLAVDRYRQKVARA